MKNIFTIFLLFNSYIINGQDDIQLQLEVLSNTNKSFFATRGEEKFLWDHHYIRLEFIFNALDSTQLLFDDRTLCISCVSKTYSFSENLDSIAINLENSELVIENKTHEFRIFTTTRNVEGMFVSTQDRYYACGEAYIDEPCEEIYELTGDKSVKFKVDILVNDLKIQDTDEEIRLHYVFKPTERQQKLGFTQSFILTSNWIKLTE